MQVQTGNSLFKTYPRVWIGLGIFCLSFISCFQTNPQIIPDIQKAISLLVKPVIHVVGRSIFSEGITNTALLSDTKALYVFLLIIVLVSFSIALIIKRSWLVKINPKADYWLTVIYRYYLAYQLLHYGFNKIFKWQFFLPEPNTVYAELGQITPDLLYWSAIGSSYSYTVFAGVLEIITALMLLFKRTYKIGAILSVIIFSNIVLVNFTFNISVKVFSTFLLLLSILLLSSSIKPLISLLLNSRVEQRPIVNHSTSKNPWVYRITKTMIIVILFIDSLYIYGKSGNWNDDNFPRMSIHGAYEVIASSDSTMQRAFINRKGYLILEDLNGNRSDYQITVDTITKLIELERFDTTTMFQYEFTDEYTLLLKSFKPLSYYQLRRIPYRSLPIFSNNFDWWID